MWRKSRASDEQVLEAYSRLKSGRKAALEVGLSVPTVYLILAKHGVERHSNNPHYDRRKGHVTDEQIIESYNSHGNGLKAAKSLGVSEATVYTTLARHGIGTKKPRDRIRSFDPEMVEGLIRRYEEGLSIARISDETGVSAPTVWAYLQRAGVKTARRSRLSRGQKQEIRDGYLAGRHLIAIAVDAATTEQTVRRFLRAECKDIWNEGADRSGSKAPSYRGGRVVNRGRVYLLAEDDFAKSMADKRGYVYEHRLNLARKIGRPLLATETVHHIDGDPMNNDPANLQLRQGRHGKHVAMCCRDCGSRNIGPCQIE